MQVVSLSFLGILGTGNCPAEKCDGGLEGLPYRDPDSLILVEKGFYSIRTPSPRDVGIDALRALLL